VRDLGRNTFRNANELMSWKCRSSAHFTLAVAGGKTITTESKWASHSRNLAKPNINARTLVRKEARAVRWRECKATEQDLKFEKRNEERRLQREEWKRRKEEMRRERAHIDALFEQILALGEQFRDRASLDNE
jgi:hypothetical protein